jgi:hypothetical protein
MTWIYGIRQKRYFSQQGIDHICALYPVRSEPNDIPLNMSAPLLNRPSGRTIFDRSILKTKDSKVYTKDLTFLLRLLQTSRQSGTLFVESYGPSGSDEAIWQGQFQLANGIVTSCLVRNKADKQVLFVGEEAVLWLTRQGKLEWRMEEGVQTKDGMSSSYPRYEEDRREQPRSEMMEAVQSPLVRSKQLRGVPVRTVRGNTAPMGAFASREQLQVFALVDGRRTIEEIVRLLHKQPDVVIRILLDLQAIGFIA